MISFNRQLSVTSYIVIFALLQCVLITILSLGKHKVSRSHQAQFSQELLNDYAFTKTHFRDLSHLFFNTQINQPNILSQLEKAANADTSNRDSIRKQLYNDIIGPYNAAKDELRHVHFHLPNGDSLLRMHKPALYGDNLYQARESVRLIGVEKKFLEGFEMGRHFYATRYIYPLFNSENQFLGSIETGIAFSKFRKRLYQLAKGEYFLLVNESIALKKLATDGKKNFKRSDLNKHYFIEDIELDKTTGNNDQKTESHIPPPVLTKINDLIQKDVAKRLAEKEPFSLTTNVAGQDYLVSFLPIKNILNADIGYLAWYSKDLNLDLIERGYLISYLIGSVLIGIILLLYRWSTNKIFKSHAEMEQIFNTAADGMRVVDKDHNVLRVNERFLQLSGLTEKEILSSKCYEAFGGTSCMTSNCPLERIVNGGEERIEYEALKQFPNGREVPCIVTATPYRNSKGQAVGIVEDFKNISDRKEFEQKLKLLARTDGLTGLLNRRGFLRRAEQMLLLAKRQNHALFLLFADLDNMKDINDNLGHGEGDSAIQETAKLLKETYRETDIIGRLGGDEFAVLLFDVNVEEKEVIASRLEDNLEQWNKQGDKEYTLALSLGIVQTHPASEESIDALLQRADQAMYAVKKERKRKNRKGC